MAEPKRWDDLGADQAIGRPLAPETANPSSVARESLRRQTPKVGAVCPNWARTDLCGRREVTRAYRESHLRTVVKMTRLMPRATSERLRKYPEIKYAAINPSGVGAATPYLRRLVLQGLTAAKAPIKCQTDKTAPSKARSGAARRTRSRGPLNLKIETVHGSVTAAAIAPKLIGIENR